MVDLREVKLGDILDFKGTDGYDAFEEHGIVTEICEDHAIVTDIRDVKFNGVLKGINYWLDDDTAFMFYKSELEYDWEGQHEKEYVFSEDVRGMMTELVGREFTIAQLKEVCRDITTPGIYSDFDAWFNKQLEMKNIKEV